VIGAWLRSLLVDVVAEAVAEGIAKGVERAAARQRPAAPPPAAHDGILAGFAAEVERRRRREADDVYDQATRELHDAGVGR
jgi:hypothetical protein